MTEVIDSWQRFAEVTIKTNDLDPMYEVFRKMNFAVGDRNWMGCFIMYFLLFYDAGGAANGANGWKGNSDDWWETVRLLALDPSTKRGTERRHFRGANAAKAIEKLSNVSLNNPWLILKMMYDGVSPLSGATPRIKPVTYTEFYQRMTTTYAGTQFGPYFIWKLYDIFNVCLDMPISMSVTEALKYMPDEPRKAAEHFFPHYRFEQALTEVLLYISQFDHPVVPGRKCGLAEAETVLCMMKGYFKTKTHEIGDDIQDKWDQLVNHPELRVYLPPGVERDLYVRGELK